MVEEKLENKNAPVAELEQAIGLDPMSSEGSNPSWGINYSLPLDQFKVNYKVK